MDISCLNTVNRRSCRGASLKVVRFVGFFLWERHLGSAGTCQSVSLREAPYGMSVLRFHFTIDSFPILFKWESSPFIRIRDTSHRLYNFPFLNCAFQNDMQKILMVFVKLFLFTVMSIWYHPPNQKKICKKLEKQCTADTST